MAAAAAAVLAEQAERILGRPAGGAKLGARGFAAAAVERALLK